MSAHDASLPIQYNTCQYMMLLCRYSTIHVSTWCFSADTVQYMSVHDASLLIQYNTCQHMMLLCWYSTIHVSTWCFSADTVQYMSVHDASLLIQYNTCQYMMLLCQCNNTLDHPAVSSLPVNYRTFELLAIHAAVGVGLRGSESSL